MTKRKPDVIKGYPNPTKQQIRQFQRNHRVEADGVIGPVTRDKIWLERGERRYTHLIDYPLKYAGDTRSSRWFYRFLLSNPTCFSGTGLEVQQVLLIFSFVTSQWKTGFDYLSTQDGVTVGARRLAAGTLQRFIEENEVIFSEYFNPLDIHKMTRELPDDGRGRRPGYIPDVNNGFPLDDPRLREAWLAVVQDKRLWRAQAREGVELIREILELYPDWDNARLICLAVRAANSARYGFTGGSVPKLPTRRSAQRSAYRKLKRRYGTNGTRRRRIERIERIIPPDMRWERK